MSILTANLKHYYQRPAMWLMYGLLACNLFPIVLFGISKLDREKGAAFLFLLVFNWVFAIVGGSLPKGALTKPLVFCLPGHQKVPRQVILLIGIVFNLFLAGFLVVGVTKRPLFFSLTFLSIFSFGLSVFLLVILLDFCTRWGRFLWFFWPLLFLFMGTGLGNGIKDFILFNPFLCVIVGLGITILAWFLLDNRNLSRHFATTLTMVFFDSFNQAKMQKASVMDSLCREKRDATPIDDRDLFFFRQMGQAKPFSLRRNVWGMIYHRYVPTLRPNFIVTLLLMVGWTIFLSYGMCTGKSAVNMSAFFFLVYSLVPGMAIRIPYRDPLLLPISRQGRFRATLLGVFILTLITLVGFILLAAIWWAFTTYLPEVTVNGRSYSIGPVNPWYALFPLVFLPLGFILQRIGNPMLISMILIPLLTGIALPMRKFLLDMGPLHILPFAVVAWLIFAVVLHDFFRRGNLVGVRKA